METMNQLKVYKPNTGFCIGYGGQMADPDLPEKHMAVSFRYRLLDDFLKEWQLRKKQLREGEITKEEYLEWKLNWPQTADGCGRYEPKKKWRKE